MAKSLNHRVVANKSGRCSEVNDPSSFWADGCVRVDVSHNIVAQPLLLLSSAFKIDVRDL